MSKQLVDNLLYEDLTYKIRGIIFKIYNTLGFGHRESVYQKALAIEFKKQNILFDEEPRLNIIYDNVKVGTYIPDFLLYNKIILEIKSIDFLPKEAEKQLIHYLKGTNYRLGFLVNFGKSKLEIKRKIWG
ncbi:MAG: GxxExxY protein [Armatimonadetes bacterium]|nr:MAG: GxxExxY protein [Armatimonadota bacterium]